MHEAKTHLSRLVDHAAKGEPFTIAKAGTPLVKVVAIEQNGDEASWLGSMRDAGWREPETVAAFDADQAAIAAIIENGAE